MADDEQQQPLLDREDDQEDQAEVDDDATLASAAAEDEQQQRPDEAPRSRPAPSRPPPLASPPPPPPPPTRAAAGLAAALPAALSQTAVADLLEHLPEQVQRVAGTTEGVVLLFASALVFALAVAALVRALLGGGGSSSSSSRRRRAGAPRQQGPLVLLAGPSNGGKTAIFLRLSRDGGGGDQAAPLPATVASMAAETAPARVRAAAAPGAGRARTVTLLDIPGHASHRPRLEQALRDAAGVVFVVDSADVSPHRADAADALYDVLSSADFARRRLPLLIACNKSDLELDAHSADFVRRTLERQLDAMRKTRTAGIGRTAGEGGGSAPALLGVPADQAFSFAAMAPRHRVSLAEVSALQGKLAEVEAFAAGV